MVVLGNVDYYELQRLKETYNAAQESTERSRRSGPGPHGAKAEADIYFARSLSFYHSGVQDHQ